jgi:hypothetical protein
MSHRNAPIEEGVRALLSILIFAGLSWFCAARGDEAEFVPPSDAITQVRPIDLQNCGGVSKDFNDEMSEIDEQEGGAWCSAFSVRAQLNHLYKKQFSVTDLASLDIDIPPDQWARKARITGQLPISILKGAQRLGAIYLEEDYPFERDAFKAGGILYQLTKYFEKHEEPTNLVLEGKYPDIQQIRRDAINLGDFIIQLQYRYGLLLGPKSSAKRVELKPAFDIQITDSKSGIELMQSLESNIEASQPTEVAVCMAQMQSLFGIPLAPKYAKICGIHSILVVGMKSFDGVCKVHFRSSYGKDWPHKGGDGTAWIALPDFLKFLYTENNQSSLMSIGFRH